MPLRLQSMPGIAGLKKSSPSSVFIVGPRNWLKASVPAASAIASCRSRLRPSVVSIGDETLVSVATPEVASEAKDVSPARKLLTKNRATRIEVARYIVSTPFVKPSKRHGKRHARRVEVQSRKHKSCLLVRHQNSEN